MNAKLLIIQPSFYRSSKDRSPIKVRSRQRLPQVLLLQIYGKLGGLVRWLAARRLEGSTLQNLAEQTSRADNALRDFYAHQPRDTGNLYRNPRWCWRSHWTSGFGWTKLIPGPINGRPDRSFFYECYR